MARCARVGTVEMPPDIARWRKVRFRVDRGADHRRDVAQRQVLLVTEARQQSRRRLANARLFVTPETEGHRGKVIVFHARRGLNRCMAADASQFRAELQMKLMRKRPRSLGRGRACDQKRKSKSHFPL